MSEVLRSCTFEAGTQALRICNPIKAFGGDGFAILRSIVTSEYLPGILNDDL